MFTSTVKNYLRIDYKKHIFIYNGKEIAQGQNAHFTVTAAAIRFDKGNKEKRVKACDFIELQCQEQSAADAPIINFELKIKLNYTGLKFICALPSAQTPYLSMSVDTDKRSADHCSVFLGERQSHESQAVKWLKFSYKFDSDGDIINDKKETQDAADLLQKYCELVEIPFQDTREADTFKQA